MNWRYSSIGIRSLAAGLEATGRRTEVLALCTAETQRVLSAPMSSPWHDGSVVVDVSVAMEAVLGEAAVSEVYFWAIKHSLGPVMEPLLKVLLIISGRRPAAVFSRMNGTLSSVMKGVQVKWAPTSERSGVITVLHEDEVKPVSFAAWAGSLRYTFELVGVPGTVNPRRPSPDNREFQFDINW